MIADASILDPYFSLTVKGTPLGEGVLQSFTVALNENSADMLTLVIKDKTAALTGIFRSRDVVANTTGDEIEADIGTIDEHAVVFRGEIYNVETEGVEDDITTLKVTALDRKMRMNEVKKSRPFRKSLQGIVEEIAREYQFQSVNVDIKDVSFPEASFVNGHRQREESDLAFLTRLALAYRCVMYTRPKGSSVDFHFEDEEKVMGRKAALDLSFGKTGSARPLTTFTGSVDSRRKPRRRIFSSMDYSTGKVSSGTESASSVKEAAMTADLAAVADPDNTAQILALFQGAAASMAAVASADSAEGAGAGGLAAFAAAGAAAIAGRVKASKASPVALPEAPDPESNMLERVLTPPFMAQSEIDALTKHPAATRAAGMTGQGSSPDSALSKLLVGTCLDLDHESARFSGKWFVSGVHHTWDPSAGCRIDFECRR
jgi:phage protein D